MPETKNIVFTHKEVVEALIRYGNINEGLWGLYIEFGIAGANVGPGPSDLNPAAIVPVLKIGLQKSDTATSLTADAAAVNPSSKE